MSYFRTKNGFTNGNIGFTNVICEPDIEKFGSDIGVCESIIINNGLTNAVCEFTNDIFGFTNAVCELTNVVLGFTNAIYLTQASPSETIPPSPVCNARAQK